MIAICHRNGCALGDEHRGCRERGARTPEAESSKENNLPNEIEAGERANRKQIQSERFFERPDILKVERQWPAEDPVIATTGAVDTLLAER
jgi:hypothetical protein